MSRVDARSGGISPARWGAALIRCSFRAQAVSTICLSLIFHALHRVLAREPEVAEIRMYQPAHVNGTGENCHNASTQRKGISHPRGKKLKSEQVSILPSRLMEEPLPALDDLMFACTTTGQDRKISYLTGPPSRIKITLTLALLRRCHGACTKHAEDVTPTLQMISPKLDLHEVPKSANASSAQSVRPCKKASREAAIAADSGAEGALLW